MDLLADSSADGVQALQDAEQRLQDFLHLASECFWELDESLRFRSHSGGGTTAPVEEFIGRTPWEVFGSDVDSAPWRDHVAVLLARKPFQNFKHQVFTPDGKTRWRAASGRPVFDRQGRFRGYRGITTDITERKRADERLRLALDAGRAVVWEWDLATHRVMRSANAEHVYGVALSDASDFVDRIHPGDRDRHDALFEAAVAASTSYDVEFRFLRPDGGLRWFNTSARVRVERDGSKRVFGVTRDITPRKQAEGLAEGATACLRATLENMDQGLIMVDADETIRVYNRKVLDLLDLPEDLMHGSGSYTAVKRYQRERDEFARSDETRRLWFETGDFLTKTVQYERERPNGTVLEVRSTPIPGGGAVRTFTDITARRKAEIELRESEARFRNLADNAPVMVWVTEPDGSCSYLSRSWYQFTGQTPEGALGFGWLEAVHPEDRPAVEQAFHGGAPGADRSRSNTASGTGAASTGGRSTRPPRASATTAPISAMSAPSSTSRNASTPRRRCPGAGRNCGRRSRPTGCSWSNRST